MHDFDLIVTGSGPGGQKAAIAAAKLGCRVAIVERPNMLGGVCLNTGTIPSKTLRDRMLEFCDLEVVEAPIDYLVDAVFNYPTLAGSYKVAALDATNKMRQVERFSG